MALIYMDGFDHYGNLEDMNRKWDVASATSSFNAFISRAGGRRGGGAVRIRDASNSFRKDLQAVSTVVFGFALNLDGLSSTSVSDGRNICRLRDGTTSQVRLNVESDGFLRAYRGTTLLGTSTETFGTDQWDYIECKVHIDASAGSVEVRKNGTVILNLTGINTQNSANNTCNAFWLGPSTTSGPAGYYDDLYICDTSGTTNNDFLGDVRIELLKPAAVGTHDAFARSPTVTEATDSYSYWRVLIHEWSGGSFRRIAQIEMRATVGGANQSTGGTASSSSGTAENAFDGSSSTYCAFDEGEQWIQYEFGDPVSVAELAIQVSSSSANYNPTHFSLQASNDGATWKTISMHRALGDWQSSQWRYFEPATEAAILATRYPKTGTHFMGQAAGDKQSFALEEETTLPTSDLIVAVQVNNYAGKSDAGGSMVKNFVRSGTSEAAGADQALSTSHIYVRSIHEINPATGQPWLLSDVLDMEVGMEVVS